MATVLEVIKRLFPQGTDAKEPNTVEGFPAWPPDAFAVAATLANLSGCYSRSCYTVADSDSSFFSDQTMERLQEVAAHWGQVYNEQAPPDASGARANALQFLQDLWDTLLDWGDSAVHDWDPAKKRFQNLAGLL